MKFSPLRKGLYRNIIAGIIASVFVCLLIFEVYAGNPKIAGGPPFEYPYQSLKMPDGWEKQPVRYDPSVADADIVINLDQQMFPAFEPIIKKYAMEHGLKIAIDKGTCGISAGVLSRKAVDIGGFCCPPGRTDRLPGLRFHTIGIASLALIVHSENQLDNVSLEQARQIFTGEISRWSELETNDGRKGGNLPVQPIGRLHCKLRPGHWRLLLDDEDQFSSMITEVGAIPDMIYQVSSNKHAIGYETLWMTRVFQDKGKVKALKINTYRPDDPSSLISGDYPLYRVYNLTTWEGKGVENHVALKLVEYLLHQVEHLDRKFSFVPSSRLRKAGWKFDRDELVGEPDGKLINE